jgi:hypothetical protein
MKCQLFYFFVLITLISNSFQLLKRSLKAETKTENKVTKDNSEIKESVRDLNNNKINLKEGKSTNTLKEKV